MDIEWSGFYVVKNSVNVNYPANENDNEARFVGMQIECIIVEKI